MMVEAIKCDFVKISKKKKTRKEMRTYKSKSSLCPFFLIFNETNLFFYQEEAVL